MGALPVLRARLDALKTQPQGWAAHTGACGQPGHEDVEAARDESESEKQEDDDQSDVHGNPLEDERFTAVSRGAARPFYPAPASSPLRRAETSGGQRRAETLASEKSANQPRLEVAGDRAVGAGNDGDGGVEDVGEDLVAHDLFGRAHESDRPVLEGTDL